MKQKQLDDMEAMMDEQADKYKKDTIEKVAAQIEPSLSEDER